MKTKLVTGNDKKGTDLVYYAAGLDISCSDRGIARSHIKPPPIQCRECPKDYSRNPSVQFQHGNKNVKFPSPMSNWFRFPAWLARLAIHPIALSRDILKRLRLLLTPALQWLIINSSSVSAELIETLHKFFMDNPLFRSCRIGD